MTGRGRPALAMMWLLAEDGRLWFHTAEPPDLPSRFLRAGREQQDVAVMVATFNPPADVRQVRTTGRAQLGERDHDRVRWIYRRYVEAWAACSEHLSDGKGRTGSVGGVQVGAEGRAAR